MRISCCIVVKTFEIQYLLHDLSLPSFERKFIKEVNLMLWARFLSFFSQIHSLARRVEFFYIPKCYN